MMNNSILIFNKEKCIKFLIENCFEQLKLKVTEFTEKYNDFFIKLNLEDDFHDFYDYHKCYVIYERSILKSLDLWVRLGIIDYEEKRKFINLSKLWK